MAPRKRVTAQHDDWLNLTAPEPPWFALPAVTRAFPNGLDPVAAEIRAEHKARWTGDETSSGARSPDGPARAEYLDWLLRDVLGWGDGYLTGPDLPADLAKGVTRHDVTIVPTGAYRPSTAKLVGFDDETADDVAATGEQVRVLVFTLPPGTDPHDRPPADTWPANWIQRAALACRHTGVALALVTDGDHLTLVHATAGVATGAGTWRTAEFASEPILLDSFTSMLGARRFTGVKAGDEPEALLAESVRSQADVTDTLGGQVRRAVELLVNAISRANLDRDGTLLAGIEPHEVYQASATGLMRLVFLLIAEENGLLPVDNSYYQSLYAVRLLREDLLEESFRDPEALETRSTAWHRLLATARAVHAGVHHDALQAPAYGGALFNPDRFPFLEGRTKDQRWTEHAGTPIPVTDLDVLAILDALILLRPKRGASQTGTQLLSYKQVDVEQVGHIYERLLDHDTVLADEPILALRGKAGDEPEVALSALEAKRIDGTEALVDFLTDEKGKQRGCIVGTRKEVEKLLAAPVDTGLRANLRAACAGDENLARRIEPFANLLRLDLRDRPQVFRTGAYYVTETGSRRDTGTAYTTRDLADEVAEHALAPLCYAPGPQDTADTNAWRIRPSADILALRVCDPAVGSGAILVAACRYLALRLVEAWAAEGDPRAATLATAADDPNRLDVLVDARRLVAEQCCYGVDRNPMAVEMAKLSMWLATVAIDRPFTFLDHAIKAGDSLLGIWDLDQLRWLHYDVAEGRRRAQQEAYALPGLDPVDAWKCLDPMVDRALELRAEMRSLGSSSLADVERKAKLHDLSERVLASLSAVADVLTSCALTSATADSRAKSVSALNDQLLSDAGVIAAVVEAAGTPEEGAAVASARTRARRRLDHAKPKDAPPRNPLHWPLAFPEVFSDQRSGFDTIVGNPPFVGGQIITGTAGPDYRNYLVAWLAQGKKGSADLVAYFFLHAARVADSFGLLATNTVAQGDSSEVGLAQLIDARWIVHRAVSSTTWPGKNSLEIAKIWAISAGWSGEHFLDGRRVVGIDEMLYPTARSGWRKQSLAANDRQSFQGSNVLGLGFTMSPEEAAELIARDKRNADVLFPYLGGEDLNESPFHAAPRWIINFFDWEQEKARTYADCFSIVEERVKPERSKNSNKQRREIWWRFTRPTMDLYRTIAQSEHVLAICQTSKLQLPARVPTGQVFNHKLVVFPYDDYFHFGVLSSGVHWRWVLRFGSSMRLDPVYTPTDVFEPFPQPPHSHDVQEHGNTLNAHRSSLMTTNQEGLTKTYNRVHNPDDRTPGIMRLRELHMELDYAVRDAYGWQDLEDLGHGFYEVRGQGVRFTFSPEVADEVLDRLLELNKERYLGEVAAGLHQKRKEPRKSTTESLFGDTATEDDD